MDCSIEFPGYATLDWLNHVLRMRGSTTGLFAADEFRGAFLGDLRARNSSGANYEVRVDEVLDAWAGHLESHLDVERLLSFAR